MVKQRMSTADIAAMVGSLRSKNLVGMRVLNVYDVTPKVCRYYMKSIEGIYVA
jgi:predicted ribosome quality control (RQC) complex YloA/Tae2 family protein